MERGRLRVASVIVLVMVALQWTTWMGSETEPAVLGSPVQFSYFVAYGVLSVVALWGVFRLIWPSSDGDQN